MDLKCSKEGEPTLKNRKHHDVALKAAHQQSGFTLIELMVVVAIIGILASIGIPTLMKFVRGAQTTDAIENMASITKSINGMLGLPGRTVANIVTLVDGKIEDPAEVTGGGKHELTAALGPMAWSLNAQTTFEYTVHAVSNGLGGISVCISAEEGTVLPASFTALATNPGWVYYSSSPTIANGWTGNSNTTAFVTTPGTTVAGGTCAAAGAAVAAVVATPVP